LCWASVKAIAKKRRRKERIEAFMLLNLWSNGLEENRPLTCWKKNFCDMRHFIGSHDAQAADLLEV
jgi:hypothetical protein